MVRTVGVGYHSAKQCPEILDELFGRDRRAPDQILAAVFAPLHLVASAKLGAAGAFSTENIKLIEDLVGRAPITTKQFVEDFKALFS